MARLRNEGLLPASFQPGLMLWAEQLGEALGRGVARGINASLSTFGAPRPAKGPGRPSSLFSSALSQGPVPEDRQCQIQGCAKEARSKGLCSAHYQADPRRRLQGKQ